MRLKSLAKVAVVSLCLFASVSSYAWVCTATNARVSGQWYGRSLYREEARLYALQFCRQANRTLNPATCHIESCSP